MGLRQLGAANLIVAQASRPPGQTPEPPAEPAGARAAHDTHPRAVHRKDLVAARRVDIRGMITHTFRLSEWRDAFATIADQGKTGAVKVAIDHR